MFETIWLLAYAQWSFVRDVCLFTAVMTAYHHMHFIKVKVLKTAGAQSILTTNLIFLWYILHSRGKWFCLKRLENCKFIQGIFKTHSRNNCGLGPSSNNGFSYFYIEMKYYMVLIWHFMNQNINDQFIY
jgi:hypothetical protein